MSYTPVIGGPGFTLPTGGITNIAAVTHAATSKTTPVDADESPIADSAASFSLKKLTWANLKATLKTYFDSHYSGPGALLAANNLSDLTDQSVARTELSLGTLAQQDASNVAITGGAIDNTPIGANTPNTVAATTLTSSGTITATGGVRTLDSLALFIDAITGAARSIFLFITGIHLSADYIIGWSSDIAGNGDCNGNNDIAIKRGAAKTLEVTNATTGTLTDTGVILASPNGTRYRITVSNIGVVTATAA